MCKGSIIINIPVTKLKTDVGFAVTQLFINSEMPIFTRLSVSLKTTSECYHTRDMM